MTRESFWPEPAEAYADLDLVEDRQLSIRLVFKGDVFGWVVNYPLIVEMYDKAVNRSGRTVARIRNAYRTTFSKSERAKLSTYHTKFRRWYLVTGTPRQVAVHAATIRLLQKAVVFFGTI